MKDVMCRVERVERILDHFSISRTKYHPPPTCPPLSLSTKVYQALKSHKWEHKFTSTSVSWGGGRLFWRNSVSTSFSSSTTSPTKKKASIEPARSLTIPSTSTSHSSPIQVFHKDAKTEPPQEASISKSHLNCWTIIDSMAFYPLKTLHFSTAGNSLDE